MKFLSIDLPRWFDSFNRTLESCRAQISEPDVAEAVLALSLSRRATRTKTKTKQLLQKKL